MEKEIKKKYCDKHFKTNLAKALKLNAGEPGNLDKIQNNRHLSTFPAEKIIEFTNNVSYDVQKFVNLTIEEMRSKEILSFTQILNDLNESTKPQELTLLMKMNSNNDVDYVKPDGIKFDSLNKFIYTALNGSIDYSDLNEETKKVLYDTHQMLMERVDKDAEYYLEDLKSKIGTACIENTHQTLPKISEMFQDKTLNPFLLPFDYFLNE